MNKTKLLLSKPNVTQLKATSVEVRHSSHFEPTPHHNTPNFSASSRHTRELKFGTEHSLDQPVCLGKYFVKIIKTS